MKNKITPIYILGILLLFFSMFTSVHLRCEELTQDILYVGGNGEGNYSSIQVAIQNASEGDTIKVFNGIYNESIIIDKSINISGEYNKKTILQPDNNKTAVINVRDTNYVNISYFRIKKSKHEGIEIANSSNCSFSNNIITNVTGGINIQNSNHITIYQNEINHSYLFGIKLSYTNHYVNNSNKKISNNNILYNKIINNSGTGISISGSSNNTISNNHIADNNGLGISINKTTINESVSARITIDSSNNIVYHNNFINNSQNAKDKCDNTWYNKTLNQGNYWSDYNGSDKNNNGIGDSPYIIPDGNNTDEYPLVMPYYGRITLKEYYIDVDALYKILTIGVIIAIIFSLPIAYIWYKKTKK